MGHPVSSNLVRIVAPLQRRTVIIILLPVLGLVARIRSPPQARLRRILLVQQLLLVLNRRQPSLHLVKLRGRHELLLLRREDVSDLILRFLYAVRVLWMRIERLGERTRLLLLHGLHFFEERDKRRRII